MRRKKWSKRDGAKIEKNKIKRSVMYVRMSVRARDFNDRIFQKFSRTLESLSLFEPHPSKTGSVVNAVAHA